jgi:hypothetical protein
MFITPTVVLDLSSFLYDQWKNTGGLLRENRKIFTYDSEFGAFYLTRKIPCIAIQCPGKVQMKG